MKNSSNTLGAQNEIPTQNTQEKIDSHNHQNHQNHRHSEEGILNYFIENGFLNMAENYEKFLQSKYGTDIDFQDQIKQREETLLSIGDLSFEALGKEGLEYREQILEKLFAGDDFFEFLSSQCEGGNIMFEQKWMILSFLSSKGVKTENTGNFEIEKLYLQYPRIDSALMQNVYEIIVGILENTHIGETHYDNLLQSYGLQELKSLDLPTFQELDEVFGKTNYFHGSGRYKYAGDKTLQKVNFSQIDDVMNSLEKKGFIPHTDALNGGNNPSVSFTKSRMYAKVYSQKFHSETLQYEFFDREFWLGGYLYDFYMPAMKKISMIRTAFNLPKYSQPKVFQNWFDDIHSSVGKSPVTGEKIMEITTDIPENYGIVYGFSIQFQPLPCEFDPLRFHESRSSDSVEFNNKNITYIEVPLRNYAEVKAHFSSKGILVLPTEYIELYATRKSTIINEFFPKG